MVQETGCESECCLLGMILRIDPISLPVFLRVAARQSGTVGTMNSTSKEFE
eukprot:COSAG02_NODE_704_length_18279_cov_100.299560_10_plen_51_part_00